MDADAVRHSGARVSNDEHVDHAKLQQRYLIHYESPLGARFSAETPSAEHLARRVAGWFLEDGYPARIVVVTVEDGQPVARWID